MGETHPFTAALDSFDERIEREDRESCVAGRPHEDAVFDWEWWSRHGREWGGNAPVSDGFRFVYACESYPEGCPDAIGTMPATREPDGHPTECPDCGRPVYRLARAWQVPMRPWDVGMPPFHYDGPGVSD